MTKIDPNPNTLPFARLPVSRRPSFRDGASGTFRVLASGFMYFDLDQDLDQVPHKTFRSEYTMANFMLDHIVVV